MATPHCVQRAWRPSARPSAASPPGSRRPAARLAHAPRSSRREAASLGATAAEQELLSAVDALGRYPTALFPGDEAGRAGIDAAIAALEAATPTPAPLRSPLLLGDWQLVYASSGTYVTRTAAAQALLAASALPGVGVGDIRQALQPPPDDGGSSSSGGGGDASSSSSSSSSSGGSEGAQRQRLRTSNAAMLGLGPLGDWEVVIKGDWRLQNDSLATVVFDGFDLQLVGFLGAIKLPSMAKVSVPVPNGRSADFTTTYLSDALRVARGSTGNIFVFSRGGR